MQVRRQASLYLPMKTIYNAANAIEAHMLSNLLSQEGLSPVIQGEHLQGAIGELPAAGLVRLEVPEPEYEKAREIIARWESAQPSPTLPTPQSTRRTGGLWYFVAGVILGAGVLYALVRTPVSSDGIDHNRDGVVDERWTYSARGILLRTDIDRNLDGKIDYIVQYDERGLVQSAKGDDNFDGTYETTTSFRDGNAVTTRTDTNGDGLPDLVTHFVHGVQRSTQYINPTSGLPVRVEYFNLGVMLHADLDTDKDGKLDTRVTYTPLGEEASRGPIPR